MNPLILVAAVSGFVFVFGVAVGAYLGYRDARHDRAIMQRMALISRQRQLDVLLTVRDLVDTGNTPAACQLIDAEVAR